MSKKMLTLAAVTLLLVPAAASAQNQVSATAEVASYSSLTGAGDLDFGTLNRANAITTINAAGGTGAPTRDFAFNHSVTVGITVTPLTSGTATLGATILCAMRENSAWNAPAACGSQPLPVTTAARNVTFGFGGEITQAQVIAAPAGSYSGTITITVTAGS